MKMIKPDTPVYFFCVYATTKYTYFLRRGYHHEDRPAQERGMNIIQVDWQSHIVGNYKIHECLYGFCVDEERNKLLSVHSVDRENFSMLEYNL